jgi:hypothetical protein
MLLFVLSIVLLVLSACKIDLTNEIWMAKSDSGKAKISADFTYPNLTSILPDTSMTNNNMLSNYMDLIASTEGAKVLSQGVENLSTEGESRFVYTVEFSFENLAALNTVLASVENPAFEKQKKQLTIYPKLFSAVKAEDLSEVLGDVSVFEINHHLIFHAPAKIKADKSYKPNFIDKKTLKWDFAINADWQANPQSDLKFKY